MNFNQSRQAITPRSFWSKSILFLLFFFFAFANSNAQILEPVKWTSKIEKKSETNFVLIFDGIIEKRLAHVFAIYSGRRSISFRNCF
jgi:hypothetical protein